MTTKLLSLKELCEPSVITWINICLDCRHSKKITRVQDLAEGFRFATFVEGATNISVATSDVCEGLEEQQKTVKMALILLKMLSILEEGECSVADVIQGDPEKIRKVALKLLSWFMRSRYGVTHLSYHEITLGAQGRRNERSSAATTKPQVVCDEKTCPEIAKPLARKEL